MSQMEIDRNGNKIWRNSIGQKHREDGPAVEKYNGAMAWYVNGKLHREDGPALVNVDGHFHFGIEKKWLINGTLHREDGPAVEYANGAKAWYINGKCHRLDGPAVEYGKRKCWYVHAERYSFEDWLDQLQISDEEKILLCLKWK